MDITDPYSPTLVANCDTNGANYVAIEGKYAYVTNLSALSILDISDPYSPTIVGSCYVVSGSAEDVAISGNYAYVVDYNNGLVIVNITDLSSPTVAGSL
jgi:hypothetical protein